MSVQNQILLFQQIATFNNVPVRVANPVADAVGGALSTIPNDTKVASIAVTQTFLHLVDSDVEAAAAILYHELGHITLKHYECGDKLYVNQKHEEAADAFALQYVSKDALKRGIMFCTQVNQSSIRQCSWLRRTINKVEMAARITKRVFAIERLLETERKSKLEFQWSENSIATLNDLGLPIPVL